MKLTKDNCISPPFAFEGVVNLLIIGGVGTVTLERSVAKHSFYPLSTDLNGGVARFNCDGGCAYNGTLEERGSGVEYRFVADIEHGEIEYILTRAMR